MREEIITEEMIEKAEKEMNIVQFADTYLEAYTRNPEEDEVIIKASSPHGQFDLVSARVIRNYFDTKHIQHTGDPESLRTVIIKTTDFLKLFA